MVPVIRQLLKLGLSQLSHPASFSDVLVCSGWLSGKVKRGVTANDLTEGSRLAWTSSKEGRQTQSHSTLQQFEQDENVWKLLDFMEKIGEEHG